MILMARPITGLCVCVFKGMVSWVLAFFHLIIQSDDNAELPRGGREGGEREEGMEGERGGGEPGPLRELLVSGSQLLKSPSNYALLHMCGYACVCANVYGSVYSNSCVCFFV